MRTLIMTVSIDGILDNMKSGTKVSVSDCFFKAKFGIQCWIVENDIGTENIIGLINIPGFSDEHDTYRSELAGLYGIAIAMRILEELGGAEDPEQGGIEIGFDGIRALRGYGKYLFIPYIVYPVDKLFRHNI